MASSFTPTIRFDGGDPSDNDYTYEGFYYSFIEGDVRMVFVNFVITVNTYDSSPPENAPLIIGGLPYSATTAIHTSLFQNDHHRYAVTSGTDITFDFSNYADGDVFCGNFYYFASAS